MAYFINYWKFNDEIRKYNHKHSNVSQHKQKRQKYIRTYPL